MSVEIKQHNLLRVTQTIPNIGNTGVGAATRALGLGEASRTLNATSTPPATDAYKGTFALSGGALTLDLTALVEAGLPTLDMTGLKLQTIKVINAVGNGPLTVSEGAANGYPVYGAAGSVILPAGASNQQDYADNAADVATADADIDFAGTGSELFDLLMIFG